MRPTVNGQMGNGQAATSGVSGLHVQPASIKMLVDYPINHADLCLLQFPGGLAEACDSLSIREFGP